MKCARPTVRAVGLHVYDVMSFHEVAVGHAAAEPAFSSHPAYPTCLVRWSEALNSQTLSPVRLYNKNGSFPKQAEPQ